MRGRIVDREAVTLRLRVHTSLIRSRFRTTALTQEFANAPCLACSINACNVSSLSLFKRNFIYENLQVPYHAALGEHYCCICAFKMTSCSESSIHLAPFFAKRCPIDSTKQNVVLWSLLWGTRGYGLKKLLLCWSDSLRLMGGWPAQLQLRHNLMNVTYKWGKSTAKDWTEDGAREIFFFFFRNIAQLLEP